MIEYLFYEVFIPFFLSYLLGQVLRAIAKILKKHESVSNLIMYHWFDFWLPSQWSPVQRYRKILEKGKVNSRHNTDKISEDLPLENNPVLKNKVKRES